MALIDRSSPVFKIVSFTIIFTILAIIGKVFIDNWHKIPFEEFTINYPLLLFSFSFSVVLSSCSAWLWKYTLFILGDRPKLFETWRINVYSQIARYLPGKVWQYMGKVYWGGKIGLSNRNIILSTFLETIFLMSGAFVVSLFALPLFLTQDFLSPVFLVLVSGIIFCLLGMLKPRMLSFAVNLVGKRWITNPVAFSFSYIHIIVLVFLYSVVWLLMGLQLFLFTLSFYHMPWGQWIYLASLNAASWLVGFLSIIAPSGIGVKEGIFVLGLKSIMPVSFAIMLAVVLRLYMVFVDIIITAIFFILDKGAWQNLIEFRKSSPELKDYQS